MNWKQAAQEVTWAIKPFIDGAYRNSTSIDTFDNMNPATDQVLCQIAEGSAEDIDQAVEIARQRFEEGCWSGLTPSARKAILVRFADLIVEQKNSIALLDSLEIGKPISAALSDVSSFAAGIMRETAELTDKLYGSTAPMSASNLSFNVYEPRGVIGAIVPWNFPVVNAVIKIAPALAVGNSVVLKPSEISSSSALKLAELAIEAGIPAGVFNVVPGLGHTVGAALATHPDVDLLTFTGSTNTGRLLMTLAGQSNGKPLLLECGGKSPHVVFDDVENLDRIAEVAVQRMYWNQGQVCSALTRLIVHEDIKDKLLEKVITLTKELKPGDPLDEKTTFGSLASGAQRDRVKHYIELGIEEGAHPVLGGIYAVQAGPGCFVAPTIFDNVTTDMCIAQDEIFGPVLCVQSFATETEALEIANGTIYGLGATVWTMDFGRGKRMAKGVRAGRVAIRTYDEEESALFGMNCEPQKASGFGSESGLNGMRSYSTLKAISFSGGSQ